MIGSAASGAEAGTQATTHEDKTLVEQAARGELRHQHQVGVDVLPTLHALDAGGLRATTNFHPLLGQEPLWPVHRAGWDRVAAA